MTIVLFVYAIIIGTVLGYGMAFIITEILVPFFQSIRSTPPPPQVFTDKAQKIGIGR